MSLNVRGTMMIALILNKNQHVLCPRGLKTQGIIPVAEDRDLCARVSAGV